MTVLVTGAAGFVGGHVTDVLQSLGERPRAFVPVASGAGGGRPLSRKDRYRGCRGP